MSEDEVRNRLEALEEELSKGEFVWPTMRKSMRVVEAASFNVEKQFALLRDAADPLPAFPGRALDAPRDFDGGALARFIEEA